MRFTVTANGKVFTAAFADNETARAFARLLPAEFAMSELNGNEKYYYLDETLPTDAERVGKIEAGDVMLYGSSCIVIFYESFSTAYSYTRIGKLDDAEGLAETLGSGGVTVAFGVQQP